MRWLSDWLRQVWASMNWTPDYSPLLSKRIEVILTKARTPVTECTVCVVSETNPLRLPR